MAVSETVLLDAGVKAGLVSADALEELRLRARRERTRLVEMVVRSCRFPMAALYRALADQRGVPFLQGAELRADAEAAALLPGRLMQQRLMLPVRGGDGARLLAVADPDDMVSLDRAEGIVGGKYGIALADPDALRAAIAKACESAHPAMAPVAATSDDPVRLLDDIMRDVYLRRASDVHLEACEEGMRVRLRVDGKMHESRRLSRGDEEALVNRIKVLSGLDIAEQHVPQDGAMKYRIMGWDIPEMDLRVATVPTRWGERATLRVLGQETGRLSLEQLGMPEGMLTEFRHAITRPWGMVLVTGPTGSGKSTTLYAALRELDVDALNVLTVEDPVEQTVAGISQVQVDAKVDFAGALRSFLRHDPDVILVGEIRDRETAEIALRAAMTGHMVLSTLHTNDAAGVVTRLADIGVERFLVGATLIGALAQRLVRRLCPRCRRRRQPAGWERALLLGGDGCGADGGGAAISDAGGFTLYEPVGCPFCLGTGFRGRTGVFEAVWIDRDMRRAISDGAGEAEIVAAAKNYRTLWGDCRDKVLRGDVALEDVVHLRPEA
ncbi:MAG: GspE/PulE family protein [Acidobacteriota bacterium]|jgi:type IV pilus assembly protein PilB|nr:GspE/PulE family protein [Acidobacteriota bacterium]